jgi:hypothetical protein
MIPKSGSRFSEKIMLQRKIEKDQASNKRAHNFVLAAYIVCDEQSQSGHPGSGAGANRRR